MTDKKILNEDQLEKVNGGVKQNVLVLVNQVIQAADKMVVAKYGDKIKLDAEEYKKQLGKEIYNIYLTLRPDQKAMIDEYNAEVRWLWDNESGVIYFAE